MKQVITKIILLGLCIALIVGVVLPVAAQIKDTGAKSFNAVKNMNNNIKETP